MSAAAVQQFIRRLGNQRFNVIGIWQEPEILSYIDSLYAVVERSGYGCRIVHIPSGDLLSFEDFKKIFAACNYTRLDFHTRESVGGTNLGQLWLSCRNRHQVETVEDLSREV